MTPKTLRVRAAGDALVQNHERLEQGVNAFLGRQFAPLAMTEDGLNKFRNPDGEYQPGQWGFIPTDEVITVPNRAEYVKALKDGDLLPGDEATAKVAGVALVPLRTSPNALHDLRGDK